MNPPAASTPASNRGAPARGGGRGGRGGSAAASSSNPARRFNPYGNRASASSGPRVKTTSFPLPPADAPLTQTVLDSLIWLQYFPNEAPTVGSVLDTKQRAMQAFVDRHADLFQLDDIRTTHVCTLNVQALLGDAALQRAWVTFGADLNENPEPMLHSLAWILHRQIIRLPVAASNNTGTISSNASRINVCLRRVHVRPDGCGPCISLRSLKVCHLGRLITVRGTIIRTGTVQLISTWLAFRCGACDAHQIVQQPDGRMTVPTSCAASTCRSRSGFSPALGSPHTRTEALQTLRLQESMQGAQFESGRMPRTIDLQFAGDLVDAVCPGDVVQVNGVLKVHADESGAAKYGRPPAAGRATASLHSMYVDALSVVCGKDAKERRSDFSDADLEAIDSIRREPCVLRLLVHSLCPGIYGHDMVKAGLLLGLFGATGNSSGTSVARKRRSEAHVLVVGDPGVGKSQMLKACAGVSSRGIFVCGNSSSNAGLTVSVRHERGSGSALEAGALVLADQGCCCIDEFDKMADNHQALLEVMEEQTISVAKAGVLCSLPARTCVLAAANPAAGHYDHGRSLVDNLRMNAALLSRFDLVFVLLDRPDEHTDRLMTSHIAAMKAKTTAQQALPTSLGDATQSNHSQSPESRTLQGRLRLGATERIDVLPPQLMQKYIGYARTTVFPTLSAAAAVELKRFYLAQRAQSDGTDSTPVTTRQLEALIRLTQARARLDLCAHATAAHALDVLDIVRHSMADVQRPADGSAPFRLTGWPSTTSSGRPLGQAAQAKRLAAAMRQRSESLGRTVFQLDELRQLAATVQGVCVPDVPRLVDALNMQGVLLKKGQHMYKLLAD